jgi:hypothetical protein
MTPPSVIYDTPVVSHVTHEPLIEPLSKPLSYTAPTGVGVIHGDQNNQTKRVAEEEREEGSQEGNGTRHCSDNLYQSSIRQRCYRLVRQHAPTKVGLLTRVFRAGAVPAEVEHRAAKDHASRAPQIIFEKCADLAETAVMPGLQPMRRAGIARWRSRGGRYDCVAVAGPSRPGAHRQRGSD